MQRWDGEDAAELRNEKINGRESLLMHTGKDRTLFIMLKKYPLRS